MRTGIFFYYPEGERLRDFLEALGGILGKENVFLYDAFYSQKEYGDIGFTPEVHMLLAGDSKKLAQEISQGKLIIILCGESRRDLAHYLIPRMISVLVEVNK
jgi:hypothetical protein